MALLDVASGDVYSFEGRCPVEISAKATLVGTNGFGYDPMVYPIINETTGEISNQTMAQWSMAEKNAISHRGKALAQVAQFFREMAL
jgi:XTP/dITP diphosphohydrolase